MPPMHVEPAVGHLQHSADVGRLVLVEEQIGLRSVGVDAVLALQKAERNQRIKEIA